MQALVAAGLFDPPTVCAEDQVPEALFEFSPNPVIVGQPIQLIDTSTSQGNSIVAWAWDFGESISCECIVSAVSEGILNEAFVMANSVVRPVEDTASASLTLATAIPPVVTDDALGADGVLSPGESLSQVYEVGLAIREQFSIFVDIIGRDPLWLSNSL